MFAVGKVDAEAVNTSPFAGAQVALINDKAWCVIGSHKQWSGLLENLNLDELACPIVLTKSVISITAFDRIMKSFVSIEGVHDIDLFLHQMEQIGGNVIYPQGIIPQ
jgi:hypothetical protein